MRKNLWRAVALDEPNCDLAMLPGDFAMLPATLPGEGRESALSRIESVRVVFTFLDRCDWNQGTNGRTGIS
jgi:hypothetical protein